jgi:hypothetical protein
MHKTRRPSRYHGVTSGDEDALDVATVAFPKHRTSNAQAQMRLKCTCKSGVRGVVHSRRNAFTLPVTGARLNVCKFDHEADTAWQSVLTGLLGDSRSTCAVS